MPYLRYIPMTVSAVINIFLALGFSGCVFGSFSCSSCTESPGFLVGRSSPGGANGNLASTELTLSSRSSDWEPGEVLPRVVGRKPQGHRATFWETGHIMYVSFTMASKSAVIPAAHFLPSHLGSSGRSSEVRRSIGRPGGAHAGQPAAPVKDEVLCRDTPPTHLACWVFLKGIETPVVKLGFGAAR